MPRPECPIYRRAENREADLAQALRRLQRLTQVCRRCAERRACDTPLSIQDWMDRVIQEVLDERGG
ncbi:MAG TPA: hypothetical protein VGJ97_11745 [Anaerolineaceae bacterium]|jgi:uncharacterized protein (DUF2336 family)